MTAFDHIRCSNCCNWKRCLDYEYGECVVMMGRKVDIILQAGMEGGIVDRVETEDDFFCATFNPVPILR